MPTLLLTIIVYLLAIVLSYLLGSISTSIIVSKHFYHKDIREFGSKNAGGTNVGRVLGKKAGIVVILIDMAKAAFVYWGVYLLVKIPALNDVFAPDLLISLSITALLIGHCYPLFFNFRGGKAVSTLAGFTIASNWIFTITGLLIFLGVLKWKKYVSLSSIVTGLFLMIASWILFFIKSPFGFYLSSTNLLFYALSMTAYALILIYRHRENIKRLFKKGERKITWMK